MTNVEAIRESVMQHERKELLPESVVAHIYSGQGDQKVGMGRDYYENSLSVQREFDATNVQYRLLGLQQPLIEVMFNGPQELLDTTEYAQPATSAVQKAARTFGRELGLPEFAHPHKFVTGNSFGQMEAMREAGMIPDDEDFYRLVRVRSAAMQAACDAVPSCLWVVPHLSDEQQDELKKLDVLVCLRNSSRQDVIGATRSNFQKAEESGLLKKLRLRTTELPVAGAFHHEEIMKSAADAVEKVIPTITWKDADVDVISNLGRKNSEGQITFRSKEEGIRETIGLLKETARYDLAQDFFNAEGVTHTLEIGQKPVLSEIHKKSIGGDTRVIDAAHYLKRHWKSFAIGGAAVAGAGITVATLWNKPKS